MKRVQGSACCSRDCSGFICGIHHSKIRIKLEQTKGKVNCPHLWVPVTTKRKIHSVFTPAEKQQLCG